MPASPATPKKPYGRLHKFYYKKTCETLLLPQCLPKRGKFEVLFEVGTYILVQVHYRN